MFVLISLTTNTDELHLHCCLSNVKTQLHHRWPKTVNLQCSENIFCYLPIVEY